MRLSAAIAVAVIGLGLAACGSTDTAQTITTHTHAVTSPVIEPTTRTVTAPQVSSTAATTLASPPTTSSAETVTTTQITNPSSGGAGLTTATTAGTSQCVAGDLTLAAVGPNSAPGTAVLGFTLKNTGASACHTGGWPGVALYAPGASEPLTTSATRSTSDVLGSTPEREMTLAPGDEASFRLVLSSNSNSDAGCHTATRAQFIVPNDTTAMSVTIPDGAEYCGQATVSPLEPGATGTGQ